MTEADVIQPSASTASTGKGIRYIGNWAYAYSGIFASANPSTYLEFTTGSGLIVAKFCFMYATDAGDNANYIIELNDIEVFNMFSTSATSLSTGGISPLEMILPPFTKVRAIGSVISNRDLGFLMTGRVYGAD